MASYEAKCKHCGKSRGLHRAGTLACPTGTKTKIGYTCFSADQVFEEKVVKHRKPQPPKFVL